MESWWKNLSANLGYILIVNDSGDEKYRHWLDAEVADKVDQIVHHPQRMGYTDTMKDAWDRVNQLNYDYVFQLEDDFLLNRELVLDEWIGVMEKNPHLIQIKSQRQPWYPVEIEVGGCCNMPMVEDAIYQGRNASFPVAEHRNPTPFSGNPGLYRAWITGLGWPDIPLSETKVLDRALLVDPEANIVFWGARNDEPLTHHFGSRMPGQKGY